MAIIHDLMSIARDPNFQDRIRSVLNKSALDVMAEDAGTAFHPQRVTFASKVLVENVNLFEVCIAVLNNATIAAEADVAKTLNADFGIPDSDLPFTVNSIFNAFAGTAGVAN